MSESLVPLGTTSAEEFRRRSTPTGKPVSVVVVQRLRLSKLGDYTFAVPGPIADVAAAPGSDSEPGLRHDAIVWAGFSPGHKTLAARVHARESNPRPRCCRFALTLTRTSDALVVRGENVTGASGLVLVGPVQARSAAAALDATRRNLRRRCGRARSVRRRTEEPGLERRADLGTARGAGRSRGKGLCYRLGDGDPLAFELSVPNAPPDAKLNLTVTPVAPERLLTPPGGAATWAEALRRGLVDRATLLEKVSLARLTVARSLQYATYLANPDVRGRSKAVYVYRTAAKTAAVATAKPDDSANGTLRAILVATLAVLGTGGLVVLAGLVELALVAFLRLPLAIGWIGHARGVPDRLYPESERAWRNWETRQV